MRRLLLPLALAALTLTACSGDDEGGPATTDGAEWSGELPAVTGEFGEAPTIEFPDGGVPPELEVEVLSAGDGAEVSEGDVMVVNYHGQVWGAEAAFDESYGRGNPAVFPLDTLVAGWGEGLPGTHVGDRVLLAIPSELGYPEGNPQAGIEAGDTIVFVVDILDSRAPDAYVGDEAQATGDLPEGIAVLGDPGEPAVAEVAEGTLEPDEDAMVVLAEGSGEPIEEGQFLLIGFSATNWDGTSGGTSWEDVAWDGEPSPFPLQAPILAPAGADTMFASLVGEPVGSRFVYLSPAQEEQGLPAVTIVGDVVGTY